MGKDEYDIDEVFSLNIDPEDAIKSVLAGAGATDEDSEMDEDEPEEEA